MSAVFASEQECYGQLDAVVYFSMRRTRSSIDIPCDALASIRHCVTHCSTYSLSTCPRLLVLACTDRKGVLERIVLDRKSATVVGVSTNANEPVKCNTSSAICELYDSKSSMGKGRASRESMQISYDLGMTMQARGG
jgi:hypothetical protein